MTLPRVAVDTSTRSTLCALGNVTVTVGLVSLALAIQPP